MNPSKLLDWRGQTAVIAASGPSLVPGTPGPAVDVRIITTNTSWKVFPYADVHYACDLMWHKINLPSMPPENRRKCWTQDRNSAERWQLNWVRQSARPGLGTKDLHVNGNSGFGAINLAYLFGARRILLLGFDMKPGPAGRLHWHPDHPRPCVQNMPFKEWLFKSVALARDLEKEGCEVINCCLDSALTVFKKMPIEEALRGSQASPHGA